MDRPKDKQGKREFPGSRQNKRPRQEPPKPGSQPENRPFQESEDEELV